jgi:type IV fimbrial biogenesis protein FimT
VLKTLHGFSLIELIVGMAIFGLLLALAMPSFSGWIRNAKIRTTAESIQNGLQLARAEAVRRNTTARFQLVDSVDNTCALSTSGPSWVVSLDNPAGSCNSAASNTVAPRIVQLRNGSEGSDGNTTIAAGQSAFVFNGAGRLTPVPATNIAINITNPTAGSCLPAANGVRCLRLVVSLGGQIRMCDPALPAGDAQAC